MYCKNCRTKLPDNAKFCNECGAKITSVDCNKKSNGKYAQNKSRKGFRVFSWVIFIVLVFGITFGIVRFFITKDSRNHKVEESIVSTDTIEGMKATEDNKTVDQEFLEALEEAIVIRNKQAENETPHYEIINSELSRLEKYKLNRYSDRDLGALAYRYIVGLETQKDAMEEKYINRDIMWLTGLVQRYEALKSISERYAVIANIEGFHDHYIYQLDSQKEHLSALQSVRDDLSEQLGFNDWEAHNNYTMTHEYTNNTNYDFGIEFYISYKDDDNVIYDNTYKFYDSIPAKTNCILEFYLPLDKINGEAFHFDMNFRVVINKFS